MVCQVFSCEWRFGDGSCPADHSFLPSTFWKKQICAIGSICASYKPYTQMPVCKIWNCIDPKYIDVETKDSSWFCFSSQIKISDPEEFRTTSKVRFEVPLEPQSNNPKMSMSIRLIQQDCWIALFKYYSSLAAIFDVWNCVKCLIPQRTVSVPHPAPEQGPWASAVDLVFHFRRLPKTNRIGKKKKH